MASEQQPTWEWPAYTKVVHRSVYEAIDPTNPINSTAGKVVVVTGELPQALEPISKMNNTPPKNTLLTKPSGGASGVGLAIAQSFVRSGSKAVILLGRRTPILSAAKKDLEALGSSQILTFPVDVADETALNSAFAATEQAVGKVDIVVACAGYMPDFAPAAVAEIGDWWKAFEVNVLGLVLTFRAWLPHKSHANGTPSFVYVNAGEYVRRELPTSRWVGVHCRCAAC
jgi:hypothetical protein